MKSKKILVASLAAVLATGSTIVVCSNAANTTNPGASDEKPATSNTTSNTTGNTTSNITGNTTSNTTGNTTSNTTGNTTSNTTGNTTSNTTGNTTTDVNKTEAVEIKVENKVIAADAKPFEADAVKIVTKPGEETKGTDGVSVKLDAAETVKDATFTVAVPKDTKTVAEAANKKLTAVKSVVAEKVKAAVEEAIKAVADGNGFALDLSLTKDGKDVKPGKPVEIKVPVPAKFAGKTLFVYHIGEFGPEKIESKVADKTLVFSASEFSPFIVTDKALTNDATAIKKEYDEAVKNAAETSSTPASSTAASDTTSGKDQEGTGVALALTPVFLAGAAVAAVAISKKRK